MYNYMNIKEDNKIIRHMDENDMFIDGKKYREYNNDIKEKILKTALSMNSHLILLDLCCGRGGDLGKWQKLDCYAKVVGVDVCEKSVNEAIRRYHNVYKKKDPRMKVYFMKNIDITEQSAMHDIAIILRKRKLTQMGNFNVVSCQMALNYFLESETILLNLFEITSKALKKGGIACFSFMNGHKVMELLGKNKIYMDKGIYIELDQDAEELSERKLNEYGIMYKIFFADSNNVESYFQMTGMNREFLTFPETIESMIKRERQHLKLRYWSGTGEPKSCYNFGPSGSLSDLFSFFYLQKF